MKRDAHGGKIKYDGTNVAEDTDAALETDAKESDEGSANATRMRAIRRCRLHEGRARFLWSRSRRCVSSVQAQAMHKGEVYPFVRSVLRAMRATDVCEALRRLRSKETELEWMATIGIEKRLPWRKSLE